MYNYKDKTGNIEMLNQYMLSRTLSMFSYDSLPLSLPSVEIEKQLQKNGYTFITKVEDVLYAFTGGFGGELDPYGNPTTIIITNPSLNFNKTLNIENDGVLIKNDDLQLGISPIFEKYNTLLIENEITMYLNSYNTRIQTLISAGDDSTRESAEQYIKKMIEGELGIIGENRLFDGINAQTTQSGSSNSTTQIIEFNQYIKASLFNDVGLNANFNMKRERLNSSEVELNTDGLHPLIDNMLMNREKGIAKLNEMYQLDISVEFGSIWKTRNISDKVEDEESIVEDDESIVEDEETIVEDDESIMEDEEEKKVV